VKVLTPLAGRVVPLSEVPDPAFARGLLGQGVAVDPVVQGTVIAVAPIDGTVHILRSHAFVIVDDRGRGVLVHLGIDTVELRGAGFVGLRDKGDRVSAGDPVTRWDPALMQGRSPLCPVIALEAAIKDCATGTVEMGASLFFLNSVI
jgi:PTS system N-acetylglucosamine-specific IIA component